MKLSRSQAAIVVLAIVLCLGIVSSIFAFRFIAQTFRSALAARNEVGFVVSASAVVYRTPNSELWAPGWREPVTLADPATFKTIFHSPKFHLGADAKNVFLGEGIRVYRLSNCQPSTFRLLSPDGRFACDAQHVYFMGFKLPKADPTSFKIIGQFTAKDSAQVYVGPLVLAGADPDTFQLVQEGELPTLFAPYSDGPCTERIFRDQLLEVNGFHGQDKHKTYGGQIARR